MRFVDTNVLLYAVSEASGEVIKRKTAEHLLDSSDLALSVQVLQEFYTVSTRSSRPDRLEHDDAVIVIEAWKMYPVQPMTIAVLDAALAAKQRFQISYWDAAIIEAARALGCEVVLSEDLNHGQDFDGVRVVDPFRG